MKTRSNIDSLSLIFITAAVLPASAFSTPPAKPFRSLTTRDNTSCKAVDSTLPHTFTCKAGTNCISLDNSSSALCCPVGGNCNNIQTISCDVSRQDPASNPNGPIFTTKTQDQLPTCGGQCCPFGYACNQSGDPNKSVCQLNVDTSSLKTSNSPSSSASASSTSASTSATSSPSSTQSNASSGIDSTTSQNTRSNHFPAGVFLAGFFPGIVIGILIMLAWVIFTGRNRKPNSPHGHHRHTSSKNSTTSSFYNHPHKMVISSPIPLGMAGSRTDFLRRTTTRARSFFSNKSSPNTGAGSNPWKMPTPPAVSNIPAQPLGIPVTPERRVPAHELSTESIKVYSPPGIAHTALPVHPALVGVDKKLAPLRGMASQRARQPSPSGTAGIGSPFKTPPNNTGNTYGYQNGAETLSPARYDASGTSGTPEYYHYDNRDSTTSRPTTTFTDMLHGIGFPDPMNHNTSRNNAPAVPKVPQGYYRGDRI